MRAYLELLRLPTVFTAMADIVLGFLLTHEDFTAWSTFVRLLVASSALYLGGMVLNDVFDVDVDQRERPGRPIPSGRVSRRSATLLGGGLLLLGTLVAWTVADQSRLISVLLVAAILSYDGVLKHTVFGPLNMGTCRFLNLMLGASDFAWDDADLFWSPPQVVVAIGLGVYIMGVTLFARHEARRSSPRALIKALLVMDAGIGLLAWLVSFQPSLGRTDLTYILLAVIAFSLNSRALRGIADPESQQVQLLIKLFLLNYVTLCAAMVFWHTGNGMYAFATACLALPALLLGRLIAMT